jgi:curved DNA-binding protein CbpA
VGDALRLLQIRNVVEMARLPQARLRFDGFKPPPPWMAGVPVNALRMLREVFAVPQSLGVCRSLMQVLGGDGADVWIPPNLLRSLDHFELEQDELAALEILTAKPITLSNLFQQSNMPVGRTAALVAELVVTGMLQATQAPVAAANVVEQPSPAPAAPPRSAGAAHPGVSEEARARRRRLLQRGIANMGGFARGAGRPPPMTAPPSDDLPEAASDDLPPAAASASAPASAAARASAAPASAPAQAPPPPSAPESKEDQLRKRIEAKAPTAKSPDLFARLGLTPGATKDQVKQAFVEAAQVFHPDHLPATLVSLESLQREIFTGLKEAYDTLNDDNRRRAYEASQKAAAEAAAAPPVDAREEQAKIAAYQGDIALRKRDYATAAEQFHTAYELFPLGDYLASEAWANFSDPARSTKKARDMVEGALELHPDSERALYYMALLARLDGKADEAERMFKKVLKKNPRHIEASQELHLLKLRKKKK